MTSAARRIVLIGRNGQVSTSLFATLSAAGHQVIQLGRPEVDLARPDTVNDAILTARPEVVINAAAYTAVDRAEDEPLIAEAINATGAGVAASAAAKVGAPIIHFSTDYVFDGSKATPYVETDTPAPLGVYGRTKLAGEQLVAHANPKHIILRTAWVCSPHGNNFVRTMLRLAKERPELRVVDDQFGTPTFAADLADVVCQLLPQLEASSAADHFGIFHVVNEGETTWRKLAVAIMEGAAQRGGARVPVQPIRSEDYPSKAKRPANSVLATTKLHDVFGIRLRPWELALSECLDQIVL